jgi:hypothetical protein
LKKTTTKKAQGVGPEFKPSTTNIQKKVAFYSPIMKRMRKKSVNNSE